MARDLHISENVAILGLSLYVLGFALGCARFLRFCYANHNRVLFTGLLQVKSYLEFTLV
jgi:hypothetical protein